MYGLYALKTGRKDVVTYVPHMMEYSAPDVVAPRQDQNPYLFPYLSAGLNAFLS